MAEIKWHIGKNGPSICKATINSCPLGEENHFSSEIEAQIVYEQSMAEQHGTFSKFRNSVLNEIKKTQKEDEKISLALNAIKDNKNLIYCYSLASEISDQ